MPTVNEKNYKIYRIYRMFLQFLLNLIQFQLLLYKSLLILWGFHFFSYWGRKFVLSLPNLFLFKQKNKEINKKLVKW